MMPDGSHRAPRCPRSEVSPRPGRAGTEARAHRRGARMGGSARCPPAHGPAHGMGALDGIPLGSKIFRGPRPPAAAPSLAERLEERIAPSSPSGHARLLPARGQRWEATLKHHRPRGARWRQAGRRWPGGQHYFRACDRIDRIDASRPTSAPGHDGPQRNSGGWPTARRASPARCPPAPDLRIAWAPWMASPSARRSSVGIARLQAALP